MNELTVFENKDFGQIRIFAKDGKNLFCGKDVAEALSYKRPADAISAHCKGVCEIPTPTAGGVQKMKYITEGDLYRLIAHSELPSAEKFESWVFDEVLPSIRKTGSYSAGNDIKAMRAEAMMRNAKTREANLWLKFAAVLDSRPHKQLCASYGTQVLTGGQRVLPLPEVEKTYSAEEVGAMLGGLSGQKVGRIATKHGLKVPEYGRLTLDKSRYSSKEVETWRYNEAGVEALRQIVSKE